MKTLRKPVISSFRGIFTPIHLNAPLNAAGVESDIVGYTTVTIQPGFNLLALPFDDLSSEEGVSVQDLLKGTPTAGDTIQYWNGTGLEILTYRTRNGVSQWYKGISISNRYFYPGEGFWYYSNATENIELLVSGKVLTSENDTSIVAPADEFSLIGAPVPKTFNLSDVTFENISVGSTLQYWQDGKLNILTYRVRNDVGGWYSGIKKVETHEISPASGFWFYPTATDVTISFN